MKINYNDYVMVRTTKERLDYVSMFEGDNNLYKATHYRWKANINNISTRKYVLAVIGTRIENVYEVIKWQRAENRYGEKGNGRVEFVGIEAQDEIKRFFIGKNFTKIYQNPVQYLNNNTELI